MLARSFPFLPLVALTVVFVTACGDGGAPPTDLDGSFPFDLPPQLDAGDSGRPDLGSDAGPRICDVPGSTLGATCVTTADCNDGCFCNGFEVCLGGECTAASDPCADAFPCTATLCDEASDDCSASADDSLCDDDDPCNGAEACDVVDGCRPGVPPSCTDGDACTVDYCDPAVAGGCVYEPRDLDGDGFAARTCGGGDCDDGDPAISPGATEVCDNRIDDDCNGDIDVADAACLPDNDVCLPVAGVGGAEDITRVDDGTYALSRATTGFAPDYSLICYTGTAATTAPDAIFRFRIDAPKDITLEVEGVTSDGAITLRPMADCATGPELRCNKPTSSTVRPRVFWPSLSPGEYAVIVKAATPRVFTLHFTQSTPTGPQYDRCGSDALDISAGGTFTGSYLLTEHDYVLSCATGTLREAVLQIVVPAGEARDITLRGLSRTSTGGAASTRVALSDLCTGTIAGCVQSPTTTVPTELIRRDVPAGTYYVFLESSVTTASSWSLEALITPPAGRTPGDSCDVGVPVDITAAMGTVDVRSLDVRPDVPAFCGVNGPGSRDAFFAFTLTATHDVVVTTNSPGIRHYGAVSPVCGVVTAARAPVDCFAALGGSGSKRFLRLAAGTHFVDATTTASSGTITARVELFDPTPIPTNDTCAAATDLPDGAAVVVPLATYTDVADFPACSAATESYDAFYTFTLTVDRFVNLRAENADTLVLLRTGCADALPACGSGTPQTFTGILPAGTYIVAIESSPATARDATLRFSTTAP